MEKRLRSMYWKVCFMAVAQGVTPATARAIQPSDCLAGHMDSTCAEAVLNFLFPPPPAPAPPPGPPPPNAFLLAGMPDSGYWYWGYDFSTADPAQSGMPKFVNRSGEALIVTLSFDVPSPPCGAGCLPGVEFYFDQDVHKRDPAIQVSGNMAKTVVPLKAGDRWAFIIGLWQARRPMVSVARSDGTPVQPELAGMSARPDVSSLIIGTDTYCLCQDGSQAECNNGNHYSNGLSGSWSQTMGLARFNAWSNCQHEGS
jgi:hypothetical protein